MNMVEYFRSYAVARLGSAEGCTDLGSVYARGLGVPRDPARATALYRRAWMVTSYPL